MTDVYKIIGKARENLQSLLRGRPEAVELALACVTAGGHLLIEDVPGVGKTTLGLGLANVFGLSFKRVQMTSDLLPTDLTGVNIWDPEARTFIFREGPIFADVVLADELNRTPPKTQSALLEAMEERRVSVDGQSYALVEDFFVIATQNPVEQSGTYELPESQMDRFMICMEIGYPNPEVELELVEGKQLHGGNVHVLDRSDLHTLKTARSAVGLHRDVASYIVNIVRGTREHERVALGASPRGLLALRDASRALALLRGRDHVTPADVQYISSSVLSHRLVLRTASGGGIRREEQRQVLAEVLETVPVPG